MSCGEFSLPELPGVRIVHAPWWEGGFYYEFEDMRAYGAYLEERRAAQPRVPPNINGESLYGRLLKTAVGLFVWNWVFWTRMRLRLQDSRVHRWFFGHGTGQWWYDGHR